MHWNVKWAWLWMEIFTRLVAWVFCLQLKHAFLMNYYETKSTFQYWINICYANTERRHTRRGIMRSVWQLKYDKELSLLQFCRHAFINIHHAYAFTWMMKKIGGYALVAQACTYFQLLSYTKLLNTRINTLSYYTFLKL